MNEYNQVSENNAATTKGNKIMQSSELPPTLSLKTILS